MRYSYILNCAYCEGTLRNFDPIENYFLFSPPRAKTQRPLLVPLEYLHCVEGTATKCMYGHTFVLLNRDWMVDTLSNCEPTPGIAARLQHWPLPPSTRRLSGTRQGIAWILQGSWQSGPWFSIQIPDAGLSPTILGSQTPDSADSLLCNTRNSLLHFLFSSYIFHRYSLFYFFCSFILCLGSVLFFCSPVQQALNSTKN